MKTINPHNLLTAWMAVTVFTIMIYSCKKADIKPDVQNTQSSDVTRAKAIQAIRSKYGNVSAGFVYNVNRQAEVFYKNTSGKMVSLYGSSNFGGSNISSICPQYNCSNTGNPANLTLIYSLNYVQRFYECESNSSKSTIVVDWTISVPFSVNFATSDVNVSNTYGTIKFSPSGGSPVTLTNSAGVGNFVVTYVSSMCYNTVYHITYSFTGVPNSYMLSGTTIEANISLDNDCALLSYLSASGLTGVPSMSQNPYLPCQRIDKVYVNPNTGPSNCATATGNYAICSYPSGMTPIDYHQLEYRAVTSGSSYLWDDQGGSVYQGEPAGTGTESATINPSTGVSNLIHMTPSSGNWLVRYRNVSTSSCNTITPVNSTWSNNWTIEVWSL